MPIFQLPANRPAPFAWQACCEQLYNQFLALMRYYWVSQRPGQMDFVLVQPDGARKWCEEWLREGWPRYEGGRYEHEAAASILLQVYLDGANSPLHQTNMKGDHRVAFNHLLSALAGCFLTEDDRRTGFFPEGRSAHIGSLAERFLAKDYDPVRVRMFLGWLVQANTERPSQGISRLPTAVLRGVVFHSDACLRWTKFWQAAEKEPHFPDRIFSDPWFAGGNGAYPSEELERLGKLFNQLPHKALLRFAGEFGARWRTRIRFRATQPKPHEPITEPMDEEARRQAIQQHLLSQIPWGARRRTVFPLLQLLQAEKS